MRHWFSRALLATVLGLSGLAGWTRAGDDGVRIVPTPLAAPIPSASTYVGASVAVSAEAGDSARRQSFCERIREKWSNHPFHCYTTHHELGCGSLRSEKVFIFGSCREFFGEPCYPRPAPGTPVPPGYGRHPLSGNGGCNTPECLLNR